MGKRTPLTPEERREQVKALHERLTGHFEAMTTAGTWRAFLDHAARFHRYSANNIALIQAQCPHATQVAGFRVWAKLGTPVRKGEKAIRIFGRATYVEEGENGEKEAARTFYPLVSVFDISQTDSPAAPPPLLAGEDPQDVAAALEDYLTGAGWAVSTGPLPRGVRGQTSLNERTVTIAPGLSPAHRAKTMAHEAAHTLLHQRPASTDLDEIAQWIEERPAHEMEAESVAYVLLAMCGIDSQAYSLPYILGWSQTTTRTIQETAQRVTQAARTLHEAITKDEPEEAPQGAPESVEGAEAAEGTAQDAERPQGAHAAQAETVPAVQAAQPAPRELIPD